MAEANAPAADVLPVLPPPATADGAAEAGPGVLARDGKLKSLSGFEVVEILNDDPMAKTITLLGRFKGAPDASAVVLLARKPFDKASAGLLASEGMTLDADFHNDIYAKYVGRPAPELSQVTVDMTYPATATHISKARAQKRAMVVETPELYERVVRPYVQAIPPARLQWVYNILERKKEVERLIYEDPDPRVGFMLHPDMKWDQSQVDQLYCLALVHRRDLPSLRALTAEELPLLENVRDKGCQAIQERFGVPRSALRIFLHYQPSYYHLHVHFAHISNTGAGALAGKAVLLDEVLDTIKTFGSDAYVRKTLCYVLGEADGLWRLLAGGEGR